MSNTLTYYTPKILAMGLVALRENSIMARLVNRGFEPTAGVKGSTVDVPIPSAVTAEDVVPAASAQSVTDINPTNVQVVMTQWKQAAFVLDDKERTQVADGTVPIQLTEAAKALPTAVDAYILTKCIGIYGYGGAGGTTPFASDLSAAVNARRELARNLAPTQPRYVVLDEDAEAAALNLTAFHSASVIGQSETYREGFIKRVMGADWFMDQNIPTHTAGTLLNGSSARVALITTTVAAGASTMAVDHTTLTGTVLKGDLFTVSGATGTYVVTSTTVTASGNVATGITFSPAVKTGETFANNATVTFQAGGARSLFFHRDAFALATRPLDDGGVGMPGSIMSAVDPVSGLTLRLEISRQHKRNEYAYDILYGAELVRPALAAFILG